MSVENQRKAHSPTQAREDQIRNAQRRQDAIVEDLVIVFNTEIDEADPNVDKHTVSYNVSSYPISRLLDENAIRRLFTARCEEAGWVVESFSELRETNERIYVCITVYPQPTTVSNQPYR